MGKIQKFSALTNTWLFDTVLSMSENFFDASGSFSGYMNSDGSVYDAHGNYKGDIRNGEIISADGHYRGRIDPDGSRYDEHGSYRGHIDSGGSVCDEHGYYSGHTVGVDGPGTSFSW